jgi:hypothetical protein
LDISVNQDAGGFAFAFCTGFEQMTMNVHYSFSDDEGKRNTNIDEDARGSSNNVMPTLAYHRQEQ